MSSPNTEKIKEKLDIVDVISSYIKVDRAGINYKARCPFHNEKTPSFFISPTRQSFYCFGCGEKGDIFSFVEKFEGLDFKGALETLASKAGVELKNFKQTNDVKGEKDKLFEIMEKATQIFEKQLIENKEALNVLKKRGVTNDSIAKWRLGFAKNEWRSLYDNLQNNFSKEEMLEAGLIKKTDNETNSGQIKYYDTFRDRIMFPINDSAGRVIAFSGRAAEMAMALGMEIKTVSLPEGEDPASIIKKDPAKWKKALKESQHFIDFSLNKALEEKEDRNITKEIIKNVLPLVSLIKSELEKSIFVKKIALKMKVHEQDVLNDLKKIEKKEDPNKGEDPFKNYSKIVNLERILAGIIFLEEFNKSKKSKNLKEKWQQIVNKEKVEEILANFEKNKEALIFETEGYGEKGSLDEIAEDILKRLELKNLKTKLQKITIILDDKNLSKKDQKETKTDFNKIQKRIKELNN